MKAKLSQTQWVNAYYPFSYEKNLSQAKKLYSPYHKTERKWRTNQSTSLSCNDLSSSTSDMMNNQHLNTLMKKYFSDYQKMQKPTEEGFDSTGMVINENGLCRIQRRLLRKRVAMDFIAEENQQEDFDDLKMRENDDEGLRGLINKDDYDARLERCNSISKEGAGEEGSISNHS